MQDAYLTANEVAALFKINVETVYDLVGRGTIPATKVGGRWRFDTAELREWFRTSRDRPAEAGSGED